jgi:hypothetical protein
MNNHIRILSIHQLGNTTTLAGPGLLNDPPGTDGVGSAMKLNQPVGISFTVDGMGVIISGMRKKKKKNCRAVHRHGLQKNQNNFVFLSSIHCATDLLHS